MDTAKPLSPSVVYPETDHMGEPEVQFHIAVRLVPLLVSWLAQRGVRARVGGNQFWYRVEGDARACRAPDVYLVEGVAPDARDRGVWKTWEGHSPAFALEVVSDDRKKDYTDAPADYDAMGTRELVLFDPSATPRSRKRLRWQVYRRVRGHGFVRVFAGNGDRIESTVLGCWIRLVDEAGNDRLRLATGPHGDTLVPTDAERADEEHRAKEAALAAKQAALAAKDEALAAKDEALARAEAAEAELTRLRALFAHNDPSA